MNSLIKQENAAMTSLASHFLKKRQGRGSKKFVTSRSQNRVAQKASWVTQIEACDKIQDIQTANSGLYTIQHTIQHFLVALKPNMTSKARVPSAACLLLFLYAVSNFKQINLTVGKLETKGQETQRSRDGSTAFDNIVDEAYHRIYDNFTNPERKVFDIDKWTLKTKGGLTDNDRVALAEFYRNADSVFEYGLGESTYIADHVGVPRYAGIDSDPVWVGMARDKVSSHFRFYLADIGKTEKWGFPAEELEKSVFQYQLAPLVAEKEPFDVYMVDGRFRFACLLASFLHASSRGGNRTHTTVLVHDCHRTKVSHLMLRRKNDDLKVFDVQRAGDRVCVYRRYANTTDEQVLDLWHQNYNVYK
jgi:hypothetical protein